MIRAENVYRSLVNNLLVGATPFFMAGAFLARAVAVRAGAGSWPLQAAGAILTSAGLLFLGLSLHQWRKATPGPEPGTTFSHWTALMALGLFLSAGGFIHTWLALQPPASPSHIYNLIHQKTSLTLQGRITGLVRQGEEKASFTLELSHILYRDQRPATLRPATGKVYLAMRGHLPGNLEAGDEILTLARVKPIQNYQTPGIFDYVLHMRNKGVFCSGWIPTAHAILKLHGNGPDSLPCRFTLQRIRQKLARFLDTHLDPVSSGLYQALLIGNRSRLGRDTINNFVASGCMHLLAISGLHIGLLGLALYRILLFIGKQSQWLLLHTNVHGLAIILSLPPLLLYAILAGMGAPVVRALAMAILVATAFLLRRQHSLAHLLSAAALLLLAVKPLALFTASFQLSFAAMLGIILFFHPLARIWTVLGNKHDHNLLAKVLRWPVSAFFLSLAATAATLPLLLVHFNRFSTIGPLMNLIIEPLLCLIALPLGLIASLCIPWSPDLAAHIFKLGSLPLLLAGHLTSQAARLPLAMLWTITPSLSETVIYGLILLLFSRATIPPRWRYPAIVVLLFGLTLHFSAGLYWQEKGTTARISFLDVGRGSCTLIEFPDGTATLIDGGGSFSENFNVGERIIAPFLWKRRRWRISSLIITHPDSDHYNGLAFIIRRFQPKIIYTNGQKKNEGSYGRLMHLIRRMGIALHTPMPGHILHHDGALCRLVSLGMPGLAGRSDSDNNQSLVTRLTCANTSFLFPGDIERQAEKRLIAHGAPLRANVLLAPHHGSRTSSSETFIQRVNPELIVVSGKTAWASAYASHTDPGPHARYRLLVTGRDGTVTCTTDGNKVTTTTWIENLCEQCLAGRIFL